MATAPSRGEQQQPAQPSQPLHLLQQQQQPQPLQQPQQQQQHEEQRQPLQQRQQQQNDDVNQAVCRLLRQAFDFEPPPPPPRTWEGGVTVHNTIVLWATSEVPPATLARVGDHQMVRCLLIKRLGCFLQCPCSCTGGTAVPGYK